MRNKIPIFVAANTRTLPGFDGASNGAAGGADGTGAVTLEVVQDMIKKAVPDVNTIVNNAVANLKNKDLPKLIDDKLSPVTTQLTEIGESIKALSGAGGASGGANGGGTGGNGGGGVNKEVPPEVNAELKSLRSTLDTTSKELKDIRTERDEANLKAERSDRHGKIKMALAGLLFASDRAADTAFQTVEPFVKRMEDESLVGVAQDGTHYPMDTFFKDFITREHPYLLRGTGAAGAGASGGSGGSGRGGGMIADTSMIKPGMTPQERQSVLAAIQTSLVRP